MGIKTGPKAALFAAGSGWGVGIGPFLGLLLGLFATTVVSAQEWLDRQPNRPSGTATVTVKKRIKSDQLPPGVEAFETIQVPAKRNVTGASTSLSDTQSNDPPVVIQGNPPLVSNCQDTSETRNTTLCTAPSVGTITERRDFTCGVNGGAGTWGSWYQTASNCCNPTLSNSRTLSCDPGYTGSITQTSTMQCPAGVYGLWVTTSNTCTPSCTPTTAITTGQCPNGYQGYIEYSTPYTCSGNTLVPGATVVSRDYCEIICVADTEYREVPCQQVAEELGFPDARKPLPDAAPWSGGTIPMVKGTVYQSRTRACQNQAWSAWDAGPNGYAGCEWACPSCGDQVTYTDLSWTDYNRLLNIAGTWNNDVINAQIQFQNCGIEHHDTGQRVNPASQCSATGANNGTETWQQCTYISNNGCSDAFASIGAGNTASNVTYSNGAISFRNTTATVSVPSGVNTACTNSNPTPAGAQAAFNYTEQCPGSPVSRTVNVAPNCNWSSPPTISGTSLTGSWTCYNQPGPTVTNYAVAPGSGCNWVSGLSISGTTVSGNYRCAPPNPGTLTHNYSNLGCWWKSLLPAGGNMVTGQLVCSRKSEILSVTVGPQTYSIDTVVASPFNCYGFTGGTLSGNRIINARALCSPTSYNNVTVNLATAIPNSATITSIAGRDVYYENTETVTFPVSVTSGCSVASAWASGTNVNYTQSCTAPELNGSFSIASGITPGCTAHSPTIGSASGQGYVNFQQSCTANGSGTINNALASDLAAGGAGCTASGPTSIVANGQGGMTYNRTCPQPAATRTIALQPGDANCYLNSGLTFDSATTIRGSGYCDETRAITYGGQAIPAGVTGSGLTIATGGTQVCGTWNNWPNCTNPTQDYMCVRPPHTAPHGGTWSNVVPSVIGECGVCRNPEDHLWSGTRIPVSCAAVTCTPATQNYTVPVPCPLGTTGTRQQVCDTICPTGPTGAPAHVNCTNVGTCTPIPSNCKICQAGTPTASAHSAGLNSDACKGADFLDVEYTCNTTSITNIRLAVSEGQGGGRKWTHSWVSVPVAVGPYSYSAEWRHPYAYGPKCRLDFTGLVTQPSTDQFEGHWTMAVYIDGGGTLLNTYVEDSSTNRSDCAGLGGQFMPSLDGTAYECNAPESFYKSGEVTVGIGMALINGSVNVCDR